MFVYKIVNSPKDIFNSEIFKKKMIGQDWSIKK
jgi:hypothetical protein